ncbi:MAG: hypothetical protein JWO38_4873 [Gemmataceae bacterium]|nr:hypothetical protein [Gemmataceae bacterium]
MAIVLYERHDSRKLHHTVNAADETLHWIAKYSTDQNAIYAATLLVSPFLWDGLPRQEINCDPIGGGVWDVTVKYGFSAETQNDTSPTTPTQPDDSSTLGPEISVDLTAATAHITQSLGTVWAVTPTSGFAAQWVGGITYNVNDQVTNGGNLYKCTSGGVSSLVGSGPTGTGGVIADGSVTWAYQSNFSQIDPNAPNYQGAIAVDKDRINGCDVYTGHMEFGVTVQVYPAQLPYLRTLLGMVGRTNQALWYQFPVGTLLYLGATGTCKPGQIWTFHHKFAASPNVSNIPLGAITVPLKRGWEFLWVAYRDASVAGLMLQVPAAAYVEQVYKPAPYTLLGLG